MKRAILVVLIAGAVGLGSGCCRSCLCPGMMCDPTYCGGCGMCESDCGDCGETCGPLCEPTCGETCGPVDECSCDEACPRQCFAPGPLTFVGRLFQPYRWGNCGCGERYWGDFCGDPPYCHDPCDSCGNWAGCESGCYTATARGTSHGSSSPGCGCNNHSNRTVREEEMPMTTSDQVAPARRPTRAPTSVPKTSSRPTYRYR